MEGRLADLTEDTPTGVSFGRDCFKIEEDMVAGVGVEAGNDPAADRFLGNPAVDLEAPSWNIAVALEVVV